MGTLTTGKIKAGALGSSDSPASNTYVSFANATVTTYQSTAYTAGGQEIETFDFTENGLSTGEAFVYEKGGAGKLQGYPGLCLVSDRENGSGRFEDKSTSNHQITAAGHTHHDSGGSVTLHNPTAIYFDGTGDYLTLPASPDWNLAGLKSWTLEFWMNATNTATSWMRVMQHAQQSGAGWCIRFYSTNAYIGLTRSDKNESQLQSSSATLTNGVWYHIAFTNDVVGGISNASYFLNGKKVASGCLNSGQPDSTDWAENNTNLLYIGQRGGEDDYYFTGYLDDIRIIQGKAIYTQDFNPPSSSPKDTRAYGDVADYTKITMMGYRSASSSYFTAINYIAGDEVVAKDYMGIGHDDLPVVAYSGGTQQIIIYNHSNDTIKFTAYVETTT